MSLLLALLLIVLYTIEGKTKIQWRRYGGCKITSLPPNTHIHCHRYDRIKKLYSLYVVWGIHRRWQQIQQPGLKRFRRASKIT